MREYIVTTGQVIYQGDPVQIMADGTVRVIAANDGVKCIGVAAEYVSDSASAAGKKIMVYDDPNIIFGVQCTTGQTPAATEIGASADMIAYAAGNTTTKLSIMELAAISAQTAMFLVIGKVGSPDNAWGEHVDVMVIFNKHRYKGAGAAGI
jgi:Flp pilus assembly secretin CpaC